MSDVINDIGVPNLVPGADLNEINDFNLRPGPYQHYKGGLYVVFTIVTHMDGADGKMAELADPLVCYRDLVPIKKHNAKGVQREVHQVYARTLSEFTSTVSIDGKPVKRFAMV